jgi:phage/conjugal plasmid C-4 type zinc finger TraR family protein
MNDLDKFEYNNEEEAEIAQILALQSSMSAVARVQQALARQRSQPSLEECEKCGEDIPEARRLAIPGVTLCIYCKEASERRR